MSPYIKAALATVGVGIGIVGLIGLMMVGPDVVAMILAGGMVLGFFYMIFSMFLVLFNE